jgi:hypothetical protein
LGGDSNTARKFMVLEVNIKRWTKQKEQLINVKYTTKSLSGPKDTVPGIIAIKFSACVVHSKKDCQLYVRR